MISSKLPGLELKKIVRFLVFKQSIFGFLFISFFAFFSAQISASLIKSALDGYPTVAVVRVKVDSEFKYYDTLGQNFVSRHPSKPGYETLSDEDKQFLADTGRSMLNQVLQLAPEQFVTRNLISKGFVSSMSSAEDIYTGGCNAIPIQSERAAEMCIAAGADAVVQIQIGYFYYNRKKSMIGLFLDLPKNLYRIATFQIGKYANSVGIYAEISGYNKDGKMILKTTPFYVSSKLKDFEMPGYKFHLYPDFIGGLMEVRDRINMDEPYSRVSL